MFESSDLNPARAPGHPEPGSSTAEQPLVEHRLGKILPLSGRWLDYGCADGGYSVGLLERGAESVVGVDVIGERVEAAQQRDRRGGALEFLRFDGDILPFPDGTFDGVLMNEVLEHVADEKRSLSEIARVLRPGGRLVLHSPNRFFPAEGHGLRFSETRHVGVPVPLVPWLPARLTAPFMSARNYWPWQLRRLVEAAGLEIHRYGTAFPLFSLYLPLPRVVNDFYLAHIDQFERAPLIRWFGVSVFIEAHKPRRTADQRPPAPSARSPRPPRRSP